MPTENSTTPGVYVVVRSSYGYYPGDHYVTVEGAFSTRERAQAKIDTYTLDRHELAILELRLDDADVSEYVS